MKKSLLLLLLLCIFVSCKTQKIDLSGTYSHVNRIIGYTIIIKNDSTFSFSINVQDGVPKCEGVWRMTDYNHIELKCEEVSDISEMLTNGYMSEREHVIEIIGKNKIKYKDVILRRTK